VLFVNFTIASPAIGMTVAMGACVVFGKGGCLTLPSYQAWGFLVLATYLKTIYLGGSSKTKYPFK